MKNGKGNALAEFYSHFARKLSQQLSGTYTGTFKWPKSAV